MSTSPVESRARARRLKRSFDVVASGAALILGAPLLAAIAVAIKLEDGGPVLFRQHRAGLNTVPFTMVKFRSMIVDADQYLDADGNPTRDRVTRVGKLLRKLSLDELPQFVNVVNGDMSLIGPRPVPLEYAERMTDRQRGRFGMAPGITGLAQVSGRHSLTWSERVERDLQYVDNYSLRLDLIVLLRTPQALLGLDAQLDRRPEYDDL